jgi:hypothetical protein
VVPVAAGDAEGKPARRPRAKKPATKKAKE